MPTYVDYFKSNNIIFIIKCNWNPPYDRISRVFRAAIKQPTGEQEVGKENDVFASFLKR